jgi:3-deoxy-D-manno-octulosonate 8-phosphate phosphatase (KDO 8-P phosphatase)
MRAQPDLTAEQAAHLRLMGFDVDGVLTDGKLYFTPNGEEIKVFSCLDGHGLKMLQEAGVEVAIITGRTSEMLTRRAAELGIRHVFQGVSDKRAIMRDLRVTLDLDSDHCGYMGDDIVDLPVLRACGFSATVADGHAFVQQNVDYVATKGGGAGAVREVCEFILASQGKLDAMLNEYLCL